MVQRVVQQATFASGDRTVAVGRCKHLWVIALFTGLALLPATLPAETPSQDFSKEPLIIRGDRAVFRQLEGTGVYEGNAELQQGERKLQADRITILASEGELVQIKAEGNPVRFSEGEQLTARGNQLVYDVAGQQITLTGDAHIHHLGRTFQGGRIDYNVRTREVEASGEDGQQVILVIPANEGKAKPDSDSKGKNGS